jgi:nucleoside-diphosphate-sugar epimerase
MRVLVAGASGAIGTRLVSQLVKAGHEAIGTYRSPEHAARVRAAGGKPVPLDLLDREAVRKVVRDAKPDGIIHEATALGDIKFGRTIDKPFAQTNLIRTQGTDHLLQAAREASVAKFLAQSFAPYIYARDGGPVKTEEDPLDPNPPDGMRETTQAMRYLDETVQKAGGIALRYGGFYGAPHDGWADVVRKRQFPIVGAGTGITSFIHLDDAAAATVLALERGRPGAYNVVDDEPAKAVDWLPVMADALGAKPPRRVPPWLARVLAGNAVVTMMLEARGSSNIKAKKELGWELRYPSWRQGFYATYAGARPR